MSYTKAKQEQIRKQTAITNFRYNRFLLLRYLLALFFFVNLYWGLASFLSKGVLSLIISTLLLVVGGFAVGEHVKLYGDKDESIASKLYFNHFYYLFQLLVNFCIFVSAFTGFGFKQLFPFLISTSMTRLVIIGVAFLGSGLSLVCLHRVRAILRKKDRYYQHIKKYEKSIS